MVGQDKKPRKLHKLNGNKPVYVKSFLIFRAMMEESRLCDSTRKKTEPESGRSDVVHKRCLGFAGEPF